MKLLRDYCPINTVLHCVISILIGTFLVCATRYAQSEIHRQGGDLYEFSFCFATDEQVMPEFFLKEKEYVTLLCYTKENPMEYMLISGDETLAPLQKDYENVKRGEQKIQKDTIFWAISDRKKALENAMQDWKVSLAEEGKMFELCEGRRITAAELLGNNQYVYLLYGISWVGLLLFQIGNLMMYVKEKKRTAKVYFLLGLPRYESKLEKQQWVMQLFLCLGSLAALKRYCLKVFVPLILLFYLVAIFWSTFCVRQYMRKLL